MNLTESQLATIQEKLDTCKNTGFARQQAEHDNGLAQAAAQNTAAVEADAVAADEAADLDLVEYIKSL